MLVLISLLSPASSDTGDTAGCSEGGAPVVASYEGGACVSDDLTYACGYLPQGCLPWDEFVAYAGGQPGNWVLVDCLSGSSAHRASRDTNESYEQYDFDADGNMIAVKWQVDLGDGWCCEGHRSATYRAGELATCTPATEDTGATDSKPDTHSDTGAPHKSGICGCASAQGSSGPALAGMLLAVGWRRSRRAQPRS